MNERFFLSNQKYILYISKHLLVCGAVLIVRDASPVFLFIQHFL